MRLFTFSFNTICFFTIYDHFDDESFHEIILYFLTISLFAKKTAFDFLEIQGKNDDFAHFSFKVRPHFYQSFF